MKTLLVMVLNEILSTFNLEILGDKLFYHHRLKFGSVEFKITDLITEEDKNLLLEFLDMPYIPNPTDAEDIYCAVANSKYFTTKVFNTLKYPNENFKQFLNVIRQRKPVSIYRKLYVPGYAAMTVDKHFGTTILRSIENLENNGITRSRIRNKFNGHLIQKWITELKPGKYLFIIMDSFKKYIESEFHMNFVDYLLDRPNSLIRKDFLSYYYDELDHFDRMFLEDEIPF